MNNTPSLNEIKKTANMDPNLLTKHYKLKLMNDFMHIKYQNPKMKQSEISNQLGFSSSAVQRYRNDINMFSPYRIQSNYTNKRTKKAKNTNFDSNSHHEPDVERPQMTSNGFKTTSNETVKNKKNKLKGGSNIEINEHYLDKIFKNNNI